MLDWRPFDGDGELGARVWTWHHGVFAKLRHGKRNGLIQGFSLHVSGMGDAFDVFKGDAAACDGHGEQL